MDTGIKISTEGTEKSIKLMAEAINLLFENAFRYHITTDVQLVALEALKTCGSVNNTTIRDCTING